MFLKEITNIEDINKCISLTNSDFILPNNYRFFKILSDENKIMGFTSLDTSDINEGMCEFYISVTDNAKTHGYAWFGLIETFNQAFKDENIEKIYWKVKADNKEGIRFFKKHGFVELKEDVSQDIKIRIDNYKDYLWFVVLKGDDYENKALSKNTIASCKIIKIKTIPTIEAGELSFFEANKDIDFDIKRIYYISKAPEGIRRGFHAHKHLKQVLFCPYGKIQLILDDGNTREEITLSDPSIGIVIDKPIWREMLWLEKNSVLVVAVSDYYDPSDYIRDYSEYIKFLGDAHE